MRPRSLRPIDSRSTRDRVDLRRLGRVGTILGRNRARCSDRTARRRSPLRSGLSTVARRSQSTSDRCNLCGMRFTSDGVRRHARVIAGGCRSRRHRVGFRRRTVRARSGWDRSGTSRSIARCGGGISLRRGYRRCSGDLRPSDKPHPSGRDRLFDARCCLGNRSGAPRRCPRASRDRAAAGHLRADCVGLRDALPAAMRRERAPRAGDHVGGCAGDGTAARIRRNRNDAKRRVCRRAPRLHRPSRAGRSRTRARTVCNYLLSRRRRARRRAVERNIPVTRRDVDACVGRYRPCGKRVSPSRVPPRRRLAAGRSVRLSLAVATRFEQLDRDAVRIFDEGNGARAARRPIDVLQYLDAALAKFIDVLA